MRRKKDDKRVLRPGNGNYNKKKSRRPSFKKDNNKNSIKDSFRKGNDRPQYPQRNDNINPKKASGVTVFIIILILLAFIIGAGAGVFMSFEKDKPVNNTTTKVENVTVEMTTNLNSSNDKVVFDESDAVDYNENQSAQILGVENNPYYNN